MSLNGKWNVIIDPIEKGDWLKVWEERKPENRTDFVEYSFEGSPVLNVPGDFNTQLPELTYYVGSIWYQKSFNYSIKKNKRLFVHFGAINYLTTVYLNGKLLGKHEGGFTPFQFEITNGLNSGVNSIIIKVNNQRQKEGIPSIGYDWFNYGGITRDINIIETSESFIQDYCLQLKTNSFNHVLAG